MEEQRQRMLKLLQHNKGFDTPERWVDYGIDYNFQTIEAERREECPDCGGAVFKFIGQYIYYSTLVKLNECLSCRLVFSDTLIDPQVTRSHFENAYKDEEYFQDKRSRIFDQIAAIVDRVTLQGGNVLDIGGAKGHLLAILKKRRPDLRLVLNDLSNDACAFAASTFKLDTVCGDVKALAQISSRFDTVIMSDVLYYEPELNRLWKLLPILVSKRGTVVVRVPNKLPLICFYQFVMRLTLNKEKRELQDHIKYFNSEHIYVFSPCYLLSRLRNLGFSQTMVLPSELLVQAKGELRYAFFYRMAKALWTLSHHKFIITPSFLVIAQKSH